MGRALATMQHKMIHCRKIIFAKPNGRRAQRFHILMKKHDLTGNKRGVVLFFMFAPFFHFATQSAGMSAIKSFLHGFPKRCALRAGDEHRSPSDGLQHEPLCTAQEKQSYDENLERLMAQGARH